MFEIKKLTDREHIIRRPSMYIGGISSDESIETIIENEQATTATLNYPPGLVKIINEVIDNSVDAILKTKIGDKVSVEFKQDEIIVQDNSSGFPYNDKVQNIEDTPLVLALGNARAGSNFNDDENIGQLGTNGVGAFATNCFSKKFEVVSINNKHHQTAVWQDNAIFKDFKVKAKPKTTKTGTLTCFTPDLEKFGLTEITEDIKQVIKTRLVMLSMTYPKINFEFNNEKIKATKIQKLFEGEASIVFENDNYTVLINAKSEKTPHYSFVNGLYTKDGGTHIDVILNDITKELTSVKSSKITRSDVQNTLQVVFVGKQWRNLRFNSQTKEKITNSTKETRDYLGDISTLVDKVKKSKAIKDFIKATTNARELRADKSALKSAKKQRIKSDKFLDAQGNRDILMIVEGDSAMGGLVPSLGRKGIAYYALKGKPLNAYSSSSQKVAANKELSELLAIIHQNDFKKIAVASDQDLDGLHIRGLLLGFFHKFLPELKDRIHFLKTPVRGVLKNDKLVNWSYNLTDELKSKANETTMYFKGLGSFSPEDLKCVVRQDGFEKMLELVDLTNVEQSLENWLGDDSDIRKKFIIENDFSIAKI